MDESLCLSFRAAARKQAQPHARGIAAPIGWVLAILGACGDVEHLDLFDGGHVVGLVSAR